MWIDGKAVFGGAFGTIDHPVSCERKNTSVPSPFASVRLTFPLSLYTAIRQCFFELLETTAGNPGVGHADRSETGHFFEVRQSGIGDPGVVEVNVYELGHSFEMPSRHR